MNKKRCVSIDRHSSVQRRPRLVDAFRAFLAEGYPGADFNIAYIGYFDSPEAFARHLLEQADLGRVLENCTTQVQDYIEHDYWQFHGHWFCRY